MKLTEMIEDEKSSLGSQAALVRYVPVISRLPANIPLPFQETTLKFLSSKSVSRPSPSSLPSLSAPISAKQRTTEDLRLQEAFQGMELKSSKKVTQDRVYSMVVHPMKVSWGSYTMRMIERRRYSDELDKFMNRKGRWSSWETNGVNLECEHLFTPLNKLRYPTAYCLP